MAPKSEAHSLAVRLTGEVQSSDKLHSLNSANGLVSAAMRSLRPARGDSKLGCLLWMVVLGFGAYVVLQVIPAKMNAAELEKFMTGQAERHGEAPIEHIKKSVLVRIKDLELPVDPKALKIERGGGRLKMSYPYTVPINLVVKTWHMEFNVSVDRPIFII